MSKFNDLELVRTLSTRSDTNSLVQLVRDKNTGALFVRKIIFGIDQPLYQGIFFKRGTGSL